MTGLDTITRISTTTIASMAAWETSHLLSTRPCTTLNTISHKPWEQHPEGLH